MRVALMSTFVNVSPLVNVCFYAPIVFFSKLNYSFIVGSAPEAIIWGIEQMSGRATTPIYCILARTLENYFCEVGGMRESILSCWFVSMYLSAFPLNLRTLNVVNYSSNICSGLHLKSKIYCLGNFPALLRTNLLHVISLGLPTVHYCGRTKRAGLRVSSSSTIGRRGGKDK